ncbi:MAG: hypothetical protein B6242_02315 [Anaerolineaceae bacterium 4572_78]|nr:MAG: hypothetical protein B6242_02315 [Anaerolineaceae bacterium 4572_78]
MGTTPTPVGTTPTPVGTTPTPVGTTPTPVNPTPIVGSHTVVFDPPEVNICSGSQQTTLKLTNTNGVKGFQFEIEFDPSIVNVVDVDPNQNGVQIKLGSSFANQNPFIALNEVDNVNGKIEFAAAVLGTSTVSGDMNLVEIIWEKVGVGRSALDIKNVLIPMVGTQITVQVVDGVAITTDACGAVSGRVQLEGRYNYSHITLIDNSGNIINTSPDGTFYSDGNDILTIKAPGYLYAKIDVSTRLDGVGTATLGDMILFAGDVNSDDIVDIFDLVQIANSYHLNDPLLDLNTDGVIDIIDLVLVTNNFQKHGPVAKWR